MKYQKLKLIAKRDIKILKTKAGIQGRALIKRSKKLKKNLPKYQKKARKTSKDIEMHFRKQLNPKISIY